MDIQEEELIAMMTTHLQQRHGVPPLAGKLWAILLLDKHAEGYTFEQLVQLSKASKSSVSTSLKGLLQEERIYFTTEEGLRLKHYKPYPMSKVFERFIESISFEKQLLDKVILYKQQTQVCEKADCVKTIENIKKYKFYLDELTRITQEILQIYK